MIKGMEEKGIDHEALLNTYIKAYNDCLKGRPRDMTVGLHLCRGNFKVRNGCCDSIIVSKCTFPYREAFTSAREGTTASP